MYFAMSICSDTIKLPPGAIARHMGLESRVGLLDTGSPASSSPIFNFILIHIGASVFSDGATLELESGLGLLDGGSPVSSSGAGVLGE